MGKSKDLATGASYQDQTESDARYVNAVGDTVTGALYLNTTLGSRQLDITGVEADIWLNSTGPNKTWRILGSTGSNTHKLRFYDQSNAAERMAIDESGRVTMPYQPAMIVRHTSAETYSAYTYIDGPWTVNLNRGNNFNTSNGVYTAPIGGLYQINLVLNNRYPDEDGNFQVHVNNSLYAGLQFDPSATETSWFTHTLVGTLNLSTNDTVRIYSGSSGAVMDVSTWNHWSMYLIG